MLWHRLRSRAAPGIHDPAPSGSAPFVKQVPSRAAVATALTIAAALAGCGYGTPAKLTPAQEQARIRLIEANENLTDRQLARLCPGLYPRDFLTNTDKYPLTKRDKEKQQPKVTAADRAQAKAAGCDVRA
jgi:hypothetical protein